MSVSWGAMGRVVVVWWLVIASFVLVTAQQATAAVVTVGPADDLQGAVDGLRPGDTLRLRRGTYNQFIEVRRSGRRRAPIRIIGAGRERTVLSGHGLNWRYGLTISGSWVVVENLALRDYVRDGTPGHGVGVEGAAHDVVLRRLKVANSGTGIKIAGAGGTNSNITIDRVAGRDLTVGGVDCGPGTCRGLRITNSSFVGPGSGDDTGVDGIAVEDGRDILISNVSVRGFQGDGIDVKASRVDVHRVRVTGNGREGIKLWQGGSITTSSSRRNMLAQLVLLGTSNYLVEKSGFSGRTSYGYLVELEGGKVRLERNTFHSDVAANAGTALWITSRTISGGNNKVWAPNRTDAVIDHNGDVFSADRLRAGTWPGAMAGSNCYCPPKELD